MKSTVLPPRRKAGAKARARLARHRKRLAAWVLLLEAIDEAKQFILDAPEDVFSRTDAANALESLNCALDDVLAGRPRLHHDTY